MIGRRFLNCGISFISVQKMANIFFQNVASESEINKLRKFLDKSSFVNENGCKIWLGAVD
jgi:hypothetical protein